MSDSHIIHCEFSEEPLPNLCIWAFLQPHLDKWANLNAWKCCETSMSLTYKEYGEASLRWAKLLVQHFHLDAPLRVAGIMPNSIEIPVVFLGCAAVGATFIPINHGIHEDIAWYILKETSPHILVIDSSVAEKYSEVIEKYGRFQKVYVRSVSGNSSFGDDLFSVLYSTKETLDVEQAMKVSPEAVALISFSSGTTGSPKGILLTHRSCSDNVAAYSHPFFTPYNEATEFRQDVALALLPLAHTFALLHYSIATAVHGCFTVCFDEKKFKSIQRTLRVMEQYKPHVICCNPAHIEAMSRAGKVGKALEATRSIVNVGSPHDPRTFEKLKEKAQNKMMLQECYGSTEMGASVMSPIKNGSQSKTGKVIPHVKARFADVDTGAPITQPFLTGELFIQTPTTMIGYLNNPEATREVLVEDNWFRTGDIGFFDKDNYITVLERFKDVIAVKDKMICPSSIERILRLHEAVFDVGVVGVLDVATGEERPKAFIIKERTVDGSELVAFVEQHGSPEMKLTGGLSFVESLPRNYFGKMIRKDLRNLVWLPQN